MAAKGSSSGWGDLQKIALVIGVISGLCGLAYQAWDISDRMGWDFMVTWYQFDESMYAIASHRLMWVFLIVGFVGLPVLDSDPPWIPEVVKAIWGVLSLISLVSFFCFFAWFGPR